MIITSRQDVLDNLFAAAAGEEFASFNKKVVNTNKKLIGVKLPILRKIAKELAAESQIIDILEDEYFEETMLAGLIMSQGKNMAECYNNLVNFCPRIDNWATCDCVCSTCKIFLKDKENKFLPKFMDLAKSDHTFTARAGIVMLMNYYFKPETIESVLNFVTTIENHSYYIDMAAAWLISTAMVKFSNSTIELLSKKTLPAYIQNKAISKCQDSFRLSQENKQLLKGYKIE